MELIKGKQSKPIKCLIYGPEGIGKSTFVSYFPSPIFIDTEGSTTHMDVIRTPKPSSWTMLMEQVRYFIGNPQELQTLVIDTADWAEKMCIEQICSSRQMKSIEDTGYGRGYVYLAEEFGRLLNLLEDLREKGVNIAMTAHAQMRKFEQPDEMGAYDRWELKLQKKTAPLLKEWADMVLFANYKTYVVNVDNQGAQKGKNKAQGGKRVMYTSHHPCWDAKNRHGLPDELPFEYSAIAHCIPVKGQPENVLVPEPSHTEEPAPQQIVEEPTITPAEIPERPEPADNLSSDPLAALRDLMALKMYSDEDVRKVVSQKGYYTFNTPLEKYDPGFITGVLVGAWEQVSEMIEKNLNEETPF
ncbi:MAG: AAA family ATPase [Anaerovoracaceae bacterium]|jgi:GTPase SAR1 family protein